MVGVGIGGGVRGGAWRCVDVRGRAWRYLTVGVFRLSWEGRAIVPGAAI